MHIYIEKGQIKCYNFSFLGRGLRVTYNSDIFEKLRPPPMGFENFQIDIGTLFPHTVVGNFSKTLMFFIQGASLTNLHPTPSSWQDNVRPFLFFPMASLSSLYSIQIMCVSGSRYFGICYLVGKVLEYFSCLISHYLYTHHYSLLIQTSIKLT